MEPIVIKKSESSWGNPFANRTFFDLFGIDLKTLFKEYIDFFSKRPQTKDLLPEIVLYVVENCDLNNDQEFEKVTDFFVKRKSFCLDEGSLCNLWAYEVTLGLIKSGDYKPIDDTHDEFLEYAPRTYPTATRKSIIEKFMLADGGFAKRYKLPGHDNEFDIPGFSTLRYPGRFYIIDENCNHHSSSAANCDGFFLDHSGALIEEYPNLYRYLYVYTMFSDYHFRYGYDYPKLIHVKDMDEEKSVETDDPLKLYYDYDPRLSITCDLFPNIIAVL